jgi:hypothetical protein
MKKILFLTFCVATVCLMATAFAAGEKHSAQATPKTDLEELQKQISSLQSQVKTLEDRLANLEKHGAIITLPPSLSVPAPRQGVATGTNSPFSISGAFAAPNNPPKIWGEGECNGWRYYIIPLSAQRTDPAAPIGLAHIGQAPVDP